MNENIYQIMYIEKSTFQDYYKKRSVAWLEVFGAVGYLEIKLLGLQDTRKKKLIEWIRNII